MPLTPAVKRRNVPASAEIEPKKPRRATREARPKWRPGPADDDDDDKPTKKKRDVCPIGIFVRGAEASEGPKPKRSDKRAQWETDGGGSDCVALPWLTTGRGDDVGGEGGEESVQARPEGCGEWSRQTAAVYWRHRQAPQKNSGACYGRETAGRGDTVTEREANEATQRAE